MITEFAYAKINLTLDVKYKRPDGYHEVEMIMQSIDLYDILHLSETSSNKIEITCNVPYIPLDERNLVYRAAQVFQRKTGIQRGVAIDLKKNIPVSAGLAGGSSDAAACLRGLNRLWNLGLSLDQLAEMGAEIGSDVPFCLYGGTALATGRGEKIELLPPAPPLWVVLVKPGMSVSTAEVYRRLLVNQIEQHPDQQAMQQALIDGDFQQIVDQLGNVLEKVTFQMHPEVRLVKERMVRYGAQGALMSGSGPTVFGIFEREQRALRVCNAIRGFAREVYLCRFI